MDTQNQRKNLSSTQDNHDAASKEDNDKSFKTRFGLKIDSENATIVRNNRNKNFIGNILLIPDSVYVNIDPVYAIQLAIEHFVEGFFQVFNLTDLTEKKTEKVVVLSIKL